MDLPWHIINIRIHTTVYASEADGTDTLVRLKVVFTRCTICTWVGITLIFNNSCNNSSNSCKKRANLCNNDVVSTSAPTSKQRQNMFYLKVGSTSCAHVVQTSGDDVAPASGTDIETMLKNTLHLKIGSTSAINFIPTSGSDVKTTPKRHWMLKVYQRLVSLCLRRVKTFCRLTYTQCRMSTSCVDVITTSKQLRVLTLLKTRVSNLLRHLASTQRWKQFGFVVQKSDIDVVIVASTTSL